MSDKTSRPDHHFILSLVTISAGPVLAAYILTMHDALQVSSEIIQVIGALQTMPKHAGQPCSPAPLTHDGGHP